MTSTPAVSEAASIPTAPGRKPLVGHAVEMTKRPVGFLKSLRELGSVVRVYFGPSPAYVLTSPQAAAAALTKEGDKFGRDRFNERMRRLIGESMSTTVDAEFHRRQRRMIQPTLHPGRVDSYVERLCAVTDTVMAGWRDGQVVDWGKQMSRLVNACIASCLVAGELGRPAREEIERTFVDFLHGSLARMQSNLPLVQRLPTKANKRYAEQRARLTLAIDDAIAKYRADGNDHKDILSMIVSATDGETGEPMPADRLRDEVLGLMVGMVDSTALTMTWEFYEIGRDPDIDEAVVGELDQVLGDRPVDASSLPKLVYLDRVLTELLRMHNPAIAVLRRCTADTTIDGHRIAAGSRMVISPYALGHDREHYPDAESFNPDRWLPGNAIPHGAYLPFLSGQYKCAGEALAWATMKVAAAAMLRDWRIVPAMVEPVREVFRGSYVQASHMPMRLERRPRPAGADQ